MVAGRRDYRVEGEEGSDPSALGPPGRQALPRTQSVETMVLVCYVSNRTHSHTVLGPREGVGNHESLDNPLDPLSRGRCWDKEGMDGHEECDRVDNLDNAVVDDRMDSHQNRTGAMVEGVVGVSVDYMDSGTTLATASLGAAGRCAPEGGRFRCRSRPHTIGLVASHGRGRG